MTDLLFHTDSYLREFDAVVSMARGEPSAILLDRTAFYPRGGGQPCDVGTIQWIDDTGANRELEISSVKKDGADVVHCVAAAGGYNANISDGHDASGSGDQDATADPLGPLATLPAPGTAVTGAIDWDHRYRLMRTHTAMHILCGVVWRDYGAHVTGGNMEPLSARMDFEFENMTAEFAREVEALINKEVEEARAIEVGNISREEAFQIPDLIRTKINLLPPAIKELRTVDIVGLDLQADGGTHVANTSEVGRIRVVGHESKGRINKRLRIEIDA